MNNTSLTLSAEPFENAPNTAHLTSVVADHLDQGVAIGDMLDLIDTRCDHTTRIRVRYILEDWVNLEAVLREALTYDRDNKQAQHLLNIAVIKQQKHIDSEGDIRTKIEAEPKNGKLYLALGLILTEKGAYYEAKKTLEQAIYLEPATKKQALGILAACKSIQEKEKS